MSSYECRFCVPAALFLVQVLCIVYVSHNKKKKDKNIWSWNDLFFLQHPPPFSPPPYAPFLTLWKRSPPLTWLWGWGATDMELRGQAGLAGQVKEERRRGGRRAVCSWENLSSKQSGFLDIRIPMWRKHFPSYPPSSSSALGWAKTKNVPPLPTTRSFPSRGWGWSFRVLSDLYMPTLGS